MTGHELSSPLRYELSFTTGTLLEHEVLILSRLWPEHRDWDEVKKAVAEGNLFQVRSTASQTKLLASALKRVSALTKEELETFPNLLSSERVHLLWAAACRRFSLIGEFAEEVVRDRFLALAEKVTYEDYDQFFHLKAAWHPELENISRSTATKLRSNIFAMMREAGLITKDGTFETILFSPRVTDFLTANNPNDLRFFPVRDN